MKRFKDVLKDEQGLTLIELLATVVILAVIMGVSAMGIGKVIQNSREDAQLSNVRQVMVAAQTYEAQEAAASSPITDVTAEELINKGYMKKGTILDPTKIKVTVVPGSTTPPVSEHMKIEVLVGALETKKGDAASQNKPMTKTETELVDAKRSDLF